MLLRVQRDEVMFGEKPLRYFYMYSTFFVLRQGILWILRIVIVYAICMIPPLCPLLTLCVLALEDGSFDQPLLSLSGLNFQSLLIYHEDALLRFGVDKRMW